MYAMPRKYRSSPPTPLLLAERAGVREPALNLPYFTAGSTVRNLLALPLFAMILLAPHKDVEHRHHAAASYERVR